MDIKEYAQQLGCDEDKLQQAYEDIAQANYVHEYVIYWNETEPQDPLYSIYDIDNIVDTLTPKQAFELGQAYESVDSADFFTKKGKFYTNDDICDIIWNLDDNDCFFEYLCEFSNSFREEVLGIE